MAGTLVEKIFGRNVGREVNAGEIVAGNVDFIMGQDGTTPLAINRFNQFSNPSVAEPKKIAFVIDHSAPSPSQGVSALHKLMREFAEKHGIRLYDIGCGVCHQVMAEKHVLPWGVIVGSDSHTCTYGTLGAFSTGIGSTDAAIVYKTQKLWFRVPETFRFNISGKLPGGVYSKDLILKIIKEMGADGATYKSCEFHGGVIKELSVDARMTITNMAVEMGAKNGIIEPDQKVVDYVNSKDKRINKDHIKDLTSEGDYEKEFEFDAGDLEPQIACPHTVDNVKPVSDVEGIGIDQAFIGTCTNGRLEDLRIAAEILRGKKVKSRLIVAPASKKVFLDAMHEGLIEIFIKSGGCVVNPGCGPCVGTHQGVPSDNEVVISTANRNFKGRMGNPNAEIYLGSPAAVAASAVEGKITDPRGFL